MNNPISKSMFRFIGTLNKSALKEIKKLENKENRYLQKNKMEREMMLKHIIEKRAHIN